jgi:hypothetical protein
VTKMLQTGLSTLHQQMSFSWCNRSYIELYTSGGEGGEGGKEIILYDINMSVETETNQKEKEKVRRRLRLGNEDVQYLLLCV